MDKSRVDLTTNVKPLRPLRCRKSKVGGKSFGCNKTSQAFSCFLSPFSPTYFFARRFPSRRSPLTKGLEQANEGEVWLECKGGDPTEGTVLGCLLWKPTRQRSPLHESHLPRPVEKGKGESEEKNTGEAQKGEWREGATNKQIAQSKTTNVCVSRTHSVGRLRFHTLTSLTSVNQRLPTKNSLPMTPHPSQSTLQPSLAPKTCK